MKNLTKLAAIIVIILLFTACGSSKKGCGFTAKTELIKTINNIDFDMKLS